MNQQEATDLYALALDVQLYDHKVGRVLAEFVRHLALTEGVTPEQLLPPPEEKQTPATDVDMDIAPLGEDHSQVPTMRVPFPSRESPRDLSGEPIDRFDEEGGEREKLEDAPSSSYHKPGKHHKRKVGLGGQPEEESGESPAQEGA